MPTTSTEEQPFYPAKHNPIHKNNKMQPNQIQRKDIQVKDYAFIKHLPFQHNEHHSLIPTRKPYKRIALPSTKRNPRIPSQKKKNNKSTLVQRQQKKKN